MNDRFKYLNLEEVVSSLSSFFQKVEILEPLSNPIDENLSYKVRTDKKYHILKIYRHRDKRRIFKSIQLQNFLYDQGLPCQKIINLVDNQLFECSGFYYSLFEFIYGEPVRDVTLEYAFKILDVLKKFHEISKNYSGDIANKNLNVPPIEKGPYKIEFEKMLKMYKSISKFKDRIKNLIHGDFHFDNLLKSSEGEIFLLDFEYVRIGDPLEDLANFIFYSNCTKNNQMFSPRELFDYFVGKNNYQVSNVKTLKYYVRMVSLRYCLGSIWEFNQGYIDHRELDKRLKTIDRAESLEL